jgi:DNA-binding NtrC family response regulator
MKKRILIVDDDPAVLFALAYIYRKADYRVQEAQNGLEALTLILKAEKEQSQYDLVVTDIQMPEMTGLELIHEMMSYHIFLPVFVASGTSMELAAEDFRGNSRIQFFQKPFDFEEIIQQTAIVLEGKNEREEGSLYCRLVSKKVV